MQEIIQIQLVDKTLQAIQADSEYKTEYIIEELQQHEKAIDNMLVSYYFAERKRVYDVVINIPSIQMNSLGHGKFRVNYMLGMFNACADIDASDVSQMDILMDVDFTKRSMILTGEDIPEREPDGL